MPHQYPGITDFGGMMASGYGRVIGWLFGQLGSRTERVYDIAAMFPDVSIDVINTAYSFAQEARRAATNLAAMRDYVPADPMRYGAPSVSGTYVYDVLIPLVDDEGITRDHLRVTVSDPSIMDLESLKDKLSVLADSEMERIIGKSPGALKPGTLLAQNPEIFAVYLT